MTDTDIIPWADYYALKQLVKMKMDELGYCTDRIRDVSKKLENIISTDKNPDPNFVRRLKAYLLATQQQEPILEAEYHDLANELRRMTNFVNHILELRRNKKT